MSNDSPAGMVVPDPVNGRDQEGLPIRDLSAIHRDEQVSGSSPRFGSWKTASKDALT